MDCLTTWSYEASMTEKTFAAGSRGGRKCSFTTSAITNIRQDLQDLQDSQDNHENLVNPV